MFNSYFDITRGYMNYPDSESKTTQVSKNQSKVDPELKVSHLQHLVGGKKTILKNMKVHGKDDIQYIMEK